MDGKYRYSFQNVCKETEKNLGDGAETIFLSTRGKNPDEVSEELVSFLEFVRAGQGEAVYDVAGFDRRC